MEYQIGVFSKITQLSIKTLRYYHELAILNPVRIDHESGYRYYDQAGYEKARIILSLKELDFSLKEIKEILLNYNDDADLVQFMQQKKEDLLQKIDKYRTIEQKINTIIHTEEEAKMNQRNSDIIIKNIDPMLVASIRFKGMYHEVGMYIGKLYKHCARYVNGRVFSLYHDPEYMEEGADIEACLPVKQEINKDGITSRILEGGEAVTIVHKGPYELIGESYKHIHDFVQSHKIATLQTSREIYIKGPGMIFRGNPKKYLTEIQLMIDNSKN